MASPIQGETTCPTLAGMGDHPLPYATEGIVVSPEVPGPSMVHAADIGAATTLAVPGPEGAGLVDSLQPVDYSPGDQARASPGSSQQYVPSPSSPLVGSPLEEEDVDMFLDIENDDAGQLSSESVKKRKLVPGEASSPSYSTN